MTQCECGGSRHVWDPETLCYAPCRCLRADQAALRYSEAGVPERHLEVTWREFLQEFALSDTKGALEAAKQLRQGKRPEWLIVHGRPTRARSIAASLLMRAACDGKLSVRKTDLSSLLDAEFDKSRADETQDTEFMVLEVGSEPTRNKWTNHVLEKTINTRWARNLCLVFVTPRVPSDLPGLYKSSVLGDALKNKFRRVSISPRESRG